MVLSELAPGGTLSASGAGPATRGARPGRAVRSRAYLESRECWTQRTVYLCSGLAAAGAALVILCWYGGSDQRTAEDQAGWLIGSMLGTTVFALAGAWWVIAGFRAVRHGLRDLAADKRAYALGGQPATATAEAVESPTGLVIGAGMVRVHRADCLLVLGKQMRAVGPADDGLDGCGVCLP